jgi:Fur family zinc uptake transcriptional regulator
MATSRDSSPSLQGRADPLLTRSRLEWLAADCAARGRLLTPLRREVYELLLLRGGHASVEALLEDMRSRHARVAPMTIYRALDFLLQSGYVERSQRPVTYRVCDTGAAWPQSDAQDP